jgi:hypothetical protein
VNRAWPSCRSAPGEWAELFGEEALAAAILDRLLHDAEVLTINGSSYRLRGRLEALREPAGEVDHDLQLSVFIHRHFSMVLTLLARGV